MNWRYFIAWAPAWGYYLLGDLFSKPVGWRFFNEVDEGTWRDWMLGFFWYPYQKLMHWSLEISNWGEVGLWSEETDEDRLRDEIEEIEEERGLSAPSQD